MVDSNALGERGEAIFFVTATTFHGVRPLFRPAALGAKWPVADYAVELVDSPGKFFLVQVKATRGAVSRAERIGVDTARERIELLLATPVPTFLAAVDEPNERVFIVRPSGPKRIRSISTAFCLNEAAVRLRLHDEVSAFWDSAGAAMAEYRSAFLDR